jgi:hypothetical protein
MEIDLQRAAIVRKQNEDQSSTFKWRWILFRKRSPHHPVLIGTAIFLLAYSLGLASLCQRMDEGSFNL